VGVEKEGRRAFRQDNSTNCETWRRKYYDLGSFGYGGVGNIAEIEGRMNAKQYVDIHILNHHLISSSEDADISREDLIFQQDNDPKHTSKLAQICLM